jgi:DNA mismatch repair protein MutS
MISLLTKTENSHFIELFRKQIAQIRDIEKVCRQLISQKVYPSTMYYLFQSINIISQLNVCLYENKELCDYLCSDFNTNEPVKYIENTCSGIINDINNLLYIEECKTVNTINVFEENIIRKGVSEKLDHIVNIYNDNLNIFHEVKIRLNGLMRLHGYNNEIEYIKIHETEKSGLSLQITKTRSTLFKKVISQILNSDSIHKKIIIKEPQFEFSLSDIKFSTASSSCDEIDFTELNKVSKDILHYKEQMNTLITETYLQILQQIEKKWFHDLENLGNFIAKMDVLQCKSYIAKYYNYCKPEIVLTDSSKSFVNAYELRHCLIEHLQQNELYVTNDISLGDTMGNMNNKDGILLYGTNAVGKTSLIRALGISIILAQSGMFVPCSRFQYKPYHSIFSRILGNDNIFKGLSTFAVEMSELRIILKMADENSLILGDELCSGTETESAMSIFVAGLMELHEKESSFIFATHFHEIIN